VADSRTSWRMPRPNGDRPVERGRMEAAIDVVRRCGGTCRTRDLRAVGHHPRSIASAVAAGSIERARVGHFMEPGLAEAAKRAIRVGGRVACVSAAEVLGLRVLNPSRVLHVEVGAHGSRFRRARDGRGRILPTETRESLAFHWAVAGAPEGALPDVVDVLAQAIDCLPPLDALCVLDSAREDLPWVGHAPRLAEAEFMRLLDRISERGRSIALQSSSLSQAIGETVARVRLGEAGIATRPQAPLPGGFFADLLIGDRLIFECEGHAVHGGKDAFERDRERLAFLRGCGYLVVNFSHRQIIDDWASVLSTVRLVMRRAPLRHLV